MNRQRKLDKTTSSEANSGCKDLAVGAVFPAATADAAAGRTSLPTQDLELAARLGLQFIVADADYFRSSGERDTFSGIREVSERIRLFIKVRVFPDSQPEQALEYASALRQSMSGNPLHWILETPHMDHPERVSCLNLLASGLREISGGESQLGLWFPCAVFVPDDPDSPWDVRVARKKTGEQLDAAASLEFSDFLVLVWEGVTTVRFSPFRPFSSWTRVRHIAPPDRSDAAFFVEALSMAASLRRPMMIVDRGAASPADAARQAAGRCACLGEFAAGAGGPDQHTLLGYCWDPFISHAGTPDATGRMGLVLADSSDGSRTPWPETFRWTAACRNAFSTALTKGNVREPATRYP
ncbi:MAG TPA: hypothetical protein PLO53_09775 [Candidatus Hydrogenedentes bacterium]|nr:hypothetical protein [Candidatus Hydrogenedentota bacterium]HPU98226.1 hypothetical protein [Candidatus Hydrogenedentota bacterium]